MLSPGAYGFRIAGGPPGGWLDVEGAEGWPLLRLERDRHISLRDQAEVDWGRLRVAICPAIAEDQLVHPLLGRTLVFLAGPRSVDALHGGALVGRAGAWAITGAKGAGKSTMLARCMRDGTVVLSDDVVVLDGTRCLAGPRCIDLRHEAAARVGGGTPVRGGSRSRVALPPAPAEMELAGFVHLAWGETCELVALHPSERLSRLVALRGTDRWPRDPALVLDLAARPAFELRRPRSLDSLDRAAELLAGALEL